jgi:hypothetical protein
MNKEKSKIVNVLIERPAIYEIAEALANSLQSATCRRPTALHTSKKCLVRYGTLSQGENSTKADNVPKNSGPWK